MRVSELVSCSVVSLVRRGYTPHTATCLGSKELHFLTLSRHAQSPVALYTKLDVVCDQQATMVGRSVNDRGSECGVAARHERYNTAH